MSKSLMDAIRQTITEGARDKTSDGMTKDAKHFAQELHKVSDAGFKHMVQKDSETSDYAKMFNGDVDKAPTRPADYEPGEDLDKYVEYNEQLEIEEAKKKAEKHDEDCGCDDCSSEDNEVKEDLMRPSGYNPFTGTGGKKPVVQPANPFLGTQRKVTASGGAAMAKTISPGGTSSTAGINRASGEPTPKIKTTVTPKPVTATPVSPAARDTTTPAPKPALQKVAADAAKRMSTPKPFASGAIGGMGSMSTAAAAAGRIGKGTGAPGYPSTSKLAKNAATRITPGGTMSTPGKASSGSTIKPASPSTGVVKKGAPETAPRKRPAAPAVRPKAPVGMGSKEAIGGTGKPNIGKGGITVKQPARAAKRAPVGMKSESFEIDINGTSYLVSEAHASAIAAFVEKYGEVNEVLTKSTTAGETVSDFVHSKNPKFKGKSKNKRIQMALASYYDKQRK